MSLRTTLLFCLAAISIHAAAQRVQLVQDICLGARNSDPTALTVFNGKLHFRANDTNRKSRLWIYDGVNAPKAILDVSPDGTGMVVNGNMLVLDQKLYFIGYDPINGRAIWSYNGTDSPVLAAKLSAHDNNISIYLTAVLNNQIFLSTYGGTSSDTCLFIYDGINAPVSFGQNAGISNSGPRSFIGYNGKVYFDAYVQGTAGAELYMYDPSDRTCNLAADIYRGPGSSYITEIAELNNKLYFAARDSTLNYELYSYDGNSATRLTHIAAGTGRGVNSQPMIYRNKILFEGNSGAGSGLYEYDPGIDQASLIYTIRPGGYANVSYPIVYNDRLYFKATDGIHGYELWTYDGITVSLVSDLFPGSQGSEILSMAI